MSDSEIRSDYIKQFYREGDRMLNGHVVGYRQVGVRLTGDYELTGTAGDVANLGQALVDRFRPTQYALVTGTLADGLTFYGPTAYDEQACDDKTFDLDLNGTAFEFCTLHPLAAEPAHQDANEPGAFDALIGRFRETAAMMAASDEEAARLLAETLATGETNTEADKRQEADDAARSAVRLAYRIITGTHLDETSAATESLEVRGRVVKSMHATLDGWMTEFVTSTCGIAKGLLNGALTEDAIRFYPDGGDYPEEESRAIARAAGLDYTDGEPVYGPDGWRIDVSAEGVGLAIQSLRAVLTGDADIENGMWSFHTEALVDNEVTIEQIREVMRSCRTLTEAARLVMDAFKLPR